MRLYLKINVDEIDKARLFKGQKHTYLDVVVAEFKDGRDQYGNHGFVAQSPTKEGRARGEQSIYVGKWKYAEERPAPRQEQEPSHTPAAEAAQTDDPNLPF